MTVRTIKKQYWDIVRDFHGRGEEYPAANPPIDEEDKAWLKSLKLRQRQLYWRLFWAEFRLLVLYSSDYFEDYCHMASSKAVQKAKADIEAKQPAVFVKPFKLLEG